MSKCVLCVQVCVRTATVCSQRTLSPASPVTSCPARSSLISMSSDLFLRSSLAANFSACSLFSVSSFSATYVPCDWPVSSRQGGGA